MSKRSVDSYARFSGYNSVEKQENPTNYSSNYNDLPSQVPDPNNRFANPPPQAMDQDGNGQQVRHRVREIESEKLFQLLSDTNYRFNSKGPTKIFVKVYTNWCGPCKAISPKIEQLSMNPKYSDILFVQIDGEKITENLKKYINVSAVPIFFAFVAGKQFGEYIVGPDLKKINEKLDEMSNIN
jgi:thioredoxin 1